jgi:hypothetical protein
MADTYLIYDFGTDEEAAQRARHRIEGWKQGFRLGDKLTTKFERMEAEASGPNSESKAGKKERATVGASEAAHIRLLVRLRFSNHEKLSLERWVSRFPMEEPFKAFQGEVVHTGTEKFEETAGLFDSIRQTEPARS